MKCTCKMLIQHGENGIEFRGYRLAKPLDGPHAVWIEIECTRADAHELEGDEHCWERDGAKLTWTVPKGGVWMADVEGKQQ